MVHTLSRSCPLLVAMISRRPTIRSSGPIAPLMDTARSPLESRRRTLGGRPARPLPRRFPVEASPHRRDRLRRFAEAWRKRLEEIDFDGLNTEGKVDYLLLDNALKRDIARLDRDDEKARQDRVPAPVRRCPDEARRGQTAAGTRRSRGRPPWCCTRGESPDRRGAQDGRIQALRRFGQTDGRACGGDGRQLAAGPGAMVPVL